MDRDSDMDEYLNLGRRIAVEIGTRLKLEVQGIELPLFSAVVGWESNKYIIIKSPEPLNRVEHKLFKGNELIVRYISEGTVYAFQTRMMETITKPLHLLFIEYPRIIEHHELREQKRTRCNILTKLVTTEGENVGCIVDITRSGCRCLVQASKNVKLITFDPEETLVMHSIFPGSQHTVALNGQVKNIRRTRREIDLGISFAANTPPESKKLLNWFVDTLEDYAFL